jgi:hypothetical protein
LAAVEEVITGDASADDVYDQTRPDNQGQHGDDDE